MVATNEACGYLSISSSRLFTTESANGTSTWSESRSMSTSMRSVGSVSMCARQLSKVTLCSPVKLSDA